MIRREINAIGTIRLNSLAGTLRSSSPAFRLHKANLGEQVEAL